MSKDLFNDGLDRYDRLGQLLEQRVDQTRRVIEMQKLIVGHSLVIEFWLEWIMCEFKLNPMVSLRSMRTSSVLMYRFWWLGDYLLLIEKRDGVESWVWPIGSRYEHLFRPSL